MTTEEFRERLRFSSAAHDGEIAQKVAVADAEMTRVGINVNAEGAAAVNLLNYARELFLKAEFNFDGRGERYAAQFEAVRDAMKLSSAFTEPAQETDAAAADGAAEQSGETVQTAEAGQTGGGGGE